MKRFHARHLPEFMKRPDETIAKAFVEGKAIFIEGGNYHTEECWYRCDKLYETEYLPDRNKYLQLLPIENLAQAKQNDRDQWNKLIVTDIVFCVHCNSRFLHAEGDSVSRNTVPAMRKKK